MSGSMRYPFVVFDLDGTLVDSYPALTDAINHTLDAAGAAPLSEAELRRYVGDGVEKLLERAFRGAAVPDGARATFESRYDAICCEGSRLLEDVAATIGQLRDLGVAMTVCTNKPTSFSAKILEHLGIAQHFAAIVGPDLAGARKPEPRHVQYAIGAMHGNACDTLLVGDMPIDVAAARNAGTDVAVIATGSSSAEDLRESNPDYFLERLSDLVSVVRNGSAPHA